MHSTELGCFACPYWSIFYFILFYGVNNTGCVATNGRVIHQWWSGLDLEESSFGLTGVYPYIYHEGLTKTVKILSQESWWCGWISNQTLARYKPRALLLHWPALCMVSYIHGYCITGSFICRFWMVSGKNPADDYLEGMMNEAPGPINFTMFLTLFGERLQGTDPEDVIKNAFGCFDEENKGVINEERLRELLTSMGDRFTDEEVQ